MSQRGVLNRGQLRVIAQSFEKHGKQALTRDAATVLLRRYCEKHGIKDVADFTGYIGRIIEVSRAACPHAAEHDKRRAQQTLERLPPRVHRRTPGSTGHALARG